MNWSVVAQGFFGTLTLVCAYIGARRIPMEAL